MASPTRYMRPPTVRVMRRFKAKKGRGAMGRL
jgi:hypothetical protein